ncbi:MAG: CaiB/BaiF CoA-transferase family protein, partial [Pseudomonadota bacterium]
DRSAAVGAEANPNDLLARGRKSIAVDLKQPEGVEVVLKLVETADVLIEGFRPGVTERLGLGPDVCLARNPKLVYGRMTGWGQTGAMASAAGHDINYISLSGALHAIGDTGGRPVPPLNLVGDFGGGGMLLAFGVAAALFETQRSGQGQVIDAAMTDGSALLMNAVYGLMNSGRWLPERGTNLLDGGAHFYGTYATSDGKYISIGSIEPQFYALLLEKTGLQDDPELAKQMSRDNWPALKNKLEAVFASKTRDEWDAIMLGTDICYAPVLSFDEAINQQHNQDRATFVESAGVRQAAPAPRFSRTEPQLPDGAVAPGAHSKAILEELGLPAGDIANLLESGAVA